MFRLLKGRNVVLGQNIKYYIYFLFNFYMYIALLAKVIMSSVE